jgi:hypothetical protein
MSKALLRVKLAYNRWYLTKLHQSALSQEYGSKLTAIRDQQFLIKELENAIYENINTQG